ncbi:MAG TPA: hypothetical protein VFA26_08770 [Gemmataceae bacterium]|nr:hypothetical protein [Gemmataceae bacterium]
MNPQPANPFEVLRLDPTTPAEEVVRAAGRLRQRAADEEAVAAVRQAVQALTGRPDERRLHELLTHPGPCYHWPAAERFVAAYRRPPQPESPTPPGCPPPDLEEMAALLRPLAAEELEPAALPFETTDATEPAGEVRRQVVEALWQYLLFDLRA